MFALLSRIDYEGDELLGVYSSREAAEAAWAVYVIGDEDISGRMVVSEVVLDAPVSYPFLTCLS